ncbi:MAG: GntR family transcriptional regulator [Clostridiales bacterium]|nr:GntR family transcriptional regulator [Clostridiales bacterium]
MQQFLSLKDHVYNYISDKINEGVLKPDEKINEKVIMEDLNISRTPVREALIQLATEGYLESIPRKGFIVKQVDTEKSKELYALLGVLDAFAAELAFEFITPEDIKRMEALATQMTAAIETYDFKAYYKLQTDFHVVYIKKCHNEELIHTMKLLKRKFIRQTYSESNKEHMKTVLLKTNSEHTIIANLFKTGTNKDVSDFLKNEHWNIDYAKYDVL